MNSNSEQIYYDLTSYRERYLFNLFHEQQQDFKIIKSTPYNSNITYDFIIKSANTYSNWLVELKIKQESSTAKYLHKDGVIISPKKYNDTISEANKNNCSPYYINYFSGDKKLYVWNLLTCKAKYDEKFSRQSNDNYNSTARTEQPTYLLPMSAATVYTLKYKVTLKFLSNHAKNVLSIIYNNPDIMKIDLNKPKTKAKK
jgi:hypothetical protein